MQQEIRNLLDRLITKRNRPLIAAISAATMGWMAQPAQAAVHATQFDPPLAISAWAAMPTNDNYEILATDFDADGTIDFRLTYGYGRIEAYFNTPTRIAERGPLFIPGSLEPNISVIIDNFSVAAVPLNSWIGISIDSRGTNIFAWSPGLTNSNSLTQPLGDHQAMVINDIFVVPMQTGPAISFSTNGTLVTNIYVYPQFQVGEMANREGVMALEFNIKGETHYGYVHFDFRDVAGGVNGGSGGVIYGWAYETEPNVAIKAKPLSTSRTRLRMPHPRPISAAPGVKSATTAEPQ